MKNLNIKYKYLIVLVIFIVIISVLQIKNYYTTHKQKVVIFGSVSKNMENETLLQQHLSLLASKLDNRYDYIIPNCNSGVIGYFLKKLRLNKISKNVQTTYVTSFPPELRDTHYKVTYFNSLMDYEDEMLEKGNIFIFLPGGMGTYYELAYILFVVLEGLQTKKVLILNVNGSFNYIIDKIETLHKEGYLRKNVYNLYKKNFLITNNVEDIITNINMYNK